MSTAFKEWNHENSGYILKAEELFDAGYRRALEDAADYFDQHHHADPTDPMAMDDFDLAAKACRDLAAGVGTKNGDDDRPEFDSPHMWEEGR